MGVCCLDRCAIASLKGLEEVEMNSVDIGKASVFD